jgi:hypothetical protein
MGSGFIGTEPRDATNPIFLQKDDKFSIWKPPKSNQIFVSIIYSFIRSILYESLFTKSLLRFGKDLVRFGGKVHILTKSYQIFTKS